MRPEDFSGEPKPWAACQNRIKPGECKHGFFKGQLFTIQAFLQVYRKHVVHLGCLLEGGAALLGKLKKNGDLRQVAGKSVILNSMK